MGGLSAFSRALGEAGIWQAMLWRCLSSVVVCVARLEVLVRGGNVPSYADSSKKDVFSLIPSESQFNMFARASRTLQSFQMIERLACAHQPSSRACVSGIDGGTSSIGVDRRRAQLSFWGAHSHPLFWLGGFPY